MGNGNSVVQSCGCYSITIKNDECTIRPTLPHRKVVLNGLTIRQGVPDDSWLHSYGFSMSNGTLKFCTGSRLSFSTGFPRVRIDDEVVDVPHSGLVSLLRYGMIASLGIFLWTGSLDPFVGFLFLRAVLMLYHFFC